MLLRMHNILKRETETKLLEKSVMNIIRYGINHLLNSACQLLKVWRTSTEYLNELLLKSL